MPAKAAGGAEVTGGVVIEWVFEVMVIGQELADKEMAKTNRKLCRYRLNWVRIQFCYFLLFFEYRLHLAVSFYANKTSL